MQTANDIRYTFCRDYLPARDEYGNKGTFGCVDAIVGSSFYRGAAVLSVSAALRMGCGLLRLVSIPEVSDAVISARPEVTLCPISKNDRGSIAYSDFRQSYRQEKTTAVLSGCGLSAGKDTRQIVGQLLAQTKCKLILDADALNVFAGEVSALGEHHCPLIITPHVGEAARLLSMSIDDVSHSKEACALTIARAIQGTVILKDAETVVASHIGQTTVFPYPNSGLSKGGSGDVLAGMIAGIAAYSQYSTYEDALSGVSIHSLCAEEASSRFGKRSMLPSDLLTVLPAVLMKAVQ